MVREYFKFLNLFLLKRYKFLLVLTVTLSLLSAIFSGVGFGLYIPVINSFLETEHSSSIFSSMSNWILNILELQPSLLVLIVIATSVIVFGASVTYITMVLSGYLCFYTVLFFKNRLIGDVLNRPYSWFLNIQTGRVVSILSDQVFTASNTVALFFKILTHILLSAGYLVSLFIISFKLTLIMIVFGGTILYSNLYFARKIYDLAMKWRDIKLEQAFSFTESIVGIKTIKSMGLEKYREKQTSGLLHEERFIIFNNHCWHHFQPFLNYVISIILVSIGIFVGLKAFAMTGAEVIVFILVTSRINASLHNVNSTWLDLTRSFPSVEIVMEYLTKDKRKDTYANSFIFNESIKLKNVSFTYKENLVLKDVNLIIQKNQFVALVGPSGGGKTTLIDLILGLYLPVSGEILYDNNLLTYYDRKEFCKHVGVVSQDIFLFNDTIANNISYGDSEPDFERIKEAAKTAYADEFITKCFEGYETLLGDRGIKVSGGQRQRIALARALYHKPKLLILDEATSALDSESEKYIQQALKKMHGRLTIIAVAHRLSTVREADMIYYVKNGVITEYGTHEMLMKEGTYYKKLKLMQSN